MCPTQSPLPPPAWVTRSLSLARGAAWHCAARLQVHPSTGFMMARMLGSAPTVADAIVDQLSLPADKAANAGG